MVCYERLNQTVEPAAWVYSCEFKLQDWGAVVPPPDRIDTVIIP
jgi:hypothetical protein